MLLIMVVVGCVVDDWQVVQQWWGGWVWMVVVLGFEFVHGGERERERGGREIEMRERERERERDIVLGYIYFIV